MVEKLEAFDLLNGRISVRGGSFVKKVPADPDAYLLVRVLHDWSDSECVRILKSCRAAMPRSALLLVGEHLLEPDPARGKAADYLTDMQMMVMFGSARQRSGVELQALLGESGFDV